MSLVDSSQFLDTLGSYDSVEERGLAVSGDDGRTLAHLLIDQVETPMSDPRLSDLTDYVSVHGSSMFGACQLAVCGLSSTLSADLGLKSACAAALCV